MEARSGHAADRNQKAANTTKYTYDVDGNLLSVTYPESDWNVKGLTYTYNTDKWLTTVSAVVKDGTEDRTVVLRTYEYDDYGDVSLIKDYRTLSDTGEIVENPAYTVCTFTYDSYRRPRAMTYADSARLDVIREAYTYQYDKNSRLTRVTLQNLYPEEAEDQQDKVRTYVYDAIGSLLQTRVEDRLHAEKSYQTTYTYDAVGNRLTEKKSTLNDVLTEITSYVYNDLNQLTGSTTKKADETITSSKTYTYDGAGNQIKETDSISETEIVTAYDPLNRLASYVKKENGTVTVNQTNRYNGSEARIQKKESVTEDGVTTETTNNYFYSQGSVLYTEDGSGNGTSLNLLGIAGNVIATARGEEGVESYYYYQKDPTGSVTNLRDADGGSVVSYQYTDFGETSIYGDTDFYNEICYTEAIYDGVNRKKMEIKMKSSLDNFGEIFINEVRDNTIEIFEKIFDGSMKGVTAENIRNRMGIVDEEKRQFLVWLAAQIVDQCMDNMLFMLEEHEELKILYEDVNIAELSDGLSGELYTEDGLKNLVGKDFRNNCMCQKLRDYFLKTSGYAY